MSTIKKLLLVLSLLLFALSAAACFGPKLYFGTAADEDGELLYHLVSIYVKEKTGVESIRVEFADGESTEILLRQEKVDLGFQSASSSQWQSLLQLGADLHLLSGPRPTGDLQFTTVPRALAKLEKLLKKDDLALLREQVSGGTLPATAVRKLYMQRGWI